MANKIDAWYEENDRVLSPVHRIGLRRSSQQAYLRLKGH
jgi:hypothetical protein